MMITIPAALVMAALLMAPAAGVAQTKKPATKNRAVKPPPPPRPPDFTADYERIAEQQKHLARFLFVYGRISVGLEAADEKLPQTKQNRSQVATNIGGIRAGLEKLAGELRARPGIERAAARTGEAAQIAAAAEQFAAANKFNEAGRALVQAAERLADAALH